MSNQDSTLEPPADSAMATDLPPWLERLRFYFCVVVPGGVLMALEMVSSRILAPHFGNSVYVWGSIIGVFLAAMSIGYVWGGRLADKRPTLADLGRLLLLSALAQLIVLVLGKRMTAILGDWTGGTPGGALIATTVLFAPTTILLATVAPYAVKLAARELRLLGSTAGHLYAISTGGSLTGTLGATFVLIPFLQLDAIFTLLMVITLITTAIALSSQWRKEIPALAVTVLLLGGALIGEAIPEAEVEGTTVLLERISPYQTFRVFERDEVRYMASDGVTHGAIVPTTGDVPDPFYARHSSTMLLLEEEVDSLLVLGMGSGAVGAYLQPRMPELVVDYVDIDPAAIEVATEFMMFSESETSRVFVEDARRFLELRPEESWDVIFTDTYIGRSIPFHLTTVEYMRIVRERLSDDGIFMLNLIHPQFDKPFPAAVMRTVLEVFEHVYVFDVPFASNALVLATDREPGLYRDDLIARGREIDARFTAEGRPFAPPLEAVAATLRPLDVDLTDAFVLADAYAPVNHLIDMSDLESEVSAEPNASP
ncbi:MAG: fused MFS/spermidine synthase [Acidobacteriota bacterium]